MHLSTPYEWLSWIAAQHTNEIKLGLERVRDVAERLDITEVDVPVITVGGTNGKGTTVAALESIYKEAGFSVGTFTSPYLFSPNEQIKLDGKPVDDVIFCQALAAVHAAAAEIRLTPFEFQTLAAFWLFKHFPLDIWLLEVGLGGRLDAVNVLSADVAIITSIALDHMDYLGHTRAEIAFEKAGIMRSKGLAICGDEDPPPTLLEQAKKIGAQMTCLGKDFRIRIEDDHWRWYYGQLNYDQLPRTRFLPQNLACALMAIVNLHTVLPVPKTAITAGLSNMNLPARLETIPSGEHNEIHDVAHNPAAIAVLANHLRARQTKHKPHGVFSMLADKDIASSLQAIMNEIDQWYVAPIAHPRAASLQQLQDAFMKLNMNNVQFFPTLKAAYTQAQHQHTDLVVFGSFHTVAEVRSALLSRNEFYPSPASGRRWPEGPDEG